MAQEGFNERAEETHQDRSNGVISTNTTLGSTSGGDGWDEENTEANEDLQFDMPPAPPPTRENSSANRRSGIQVTDASGILPRLTQFLPNSEVYHGSGPLLSPARPLNPNSHTEITADSITGSASQNEGEEEGDEQDQDHVDWVVGEPDQETEDLWRSIFPEDGGWDVEVLEEVNVYVDEGQTVTSVTVTLTENNQSN